MFIDIMISMMNCDLTLVLVWVLAGIALLQRVYVANKYRYTIKSRSDNWLIALMVLGAFIYLTLVLFDLSDHEMRRAILRLCWIWMLSVEFWIGHREAGRRKWGNDVVNGVLSQDAAIEHLDTEECDTDR